MKLEDCSKEELIYFFNSRNVYSSEKIERDLEFAVLMFRREKAYQKWDAESKAGNKKLGKYIELIKPYCGQPYENIPDNIIKPITAVKKEYENHVKKRNRYWKEYENIGKQIDKRFRD